MKTFKVILNEVLQFIKYILIAYIICAVIAWDLNISNWWAIGRLFFAIYCLVITYLFYNVIKWHVHSIKLTKRK